MDKPRLIAEIRKDGLYLIAEDAEEDVHEEYGPIAGAQYTALQGALDEVDSLFPRELGSRVLLFPATVRRGKKGS